ncbi:unnamed protein product [Klebsiella pneumoniae subsp. rhinoscleromatis SB3432]|uniref:RelE family toxin-antitoxin system n=2 Tax=Klebsiella pneumoniae TaxID=573 RepID=A0A377XFE3_KLEPN|nr:hypothetical protein HMPREF0484_3705 [Klebsiella pneumoniae subsp. rhinoscleromatis ATCC 13884]CCI77690.1 unnamed protein product [Klebsiella pneumoniae subsp. rhinoscleromatis SB3432]STT67577.1 RelE family toxin-antitoxin system [Klebsiella pneumoniae]STV57341.1 RelE family toxin-antitoxin system [Klebsiella pneumoniae subsp. rhinoscleromatis]STT79321.1 RelE family toxin-antitoxin system [Klebsiella pneumoniae]
MTTDITELAQREKFEAWAEEVGAKPWGYLKKQRNPSGGYSVQIYTYMWAAWKAAGAELVEALEKAQQRIGKLEKKLTDHKRMNQEMAKAMLTPNDSDAAGMEIAALRQRIAELESRTVKLPDLRQIVSGDRYAWSDGVYNYSQDVKVVLADAGIKVGAE